MNQFKEDLIEAFRLMPTLGVVNMAEGLFRAHHSDKLKWRFLGLMPSVDTPADREANKEDWPPDEIQYIIEETGAPTFDEFLNRIRPTVHRHLNRQIFILLTTALDSLLDRRGFSGTLGQRFGAVKKAKAVPSALDNDIQEVIQRRNDIAHGGVVTQNYITGDKYPGLLVSSWLAARKPLSAVGLQHDFSLHYLYWAATAMHRLAKLC